MTSLARMIRDEWKPLTWLAVLVAMVFLGGWNAKGGVQAQLMRPTTNEDRLDTLEPLVETLADRALVLESKVERLQDHHQVADSVQAAIVFSQVRLGSQLGLVLRLLCRDPDFGLNVECREYVR